MEEDLMKLKKLIENLHNENEKNIAKCTENEIEKEDLIEKNHNLETNISFLNEKILNSSKNVQKISNENEELKDQVKIIFFNIKDLFFKKKISQIGK